MVQRDKHIKPIKNKKLNPITLFLFQRQPVCTRIHKVEGVISAIWPKQKLIEKISYRCLNCNNLNEGYVNGRLSNNKPSIFQVVKLPKKCANCETEQLVEDKTLTTYVNAIQVELRNPDTYSEIDPLKAVVFDEDAEEVVFHVGEKVVITGLIHIELVFGKWKRFPYFYAKSIRYESKEKLELKDSDIDEIRALVGEKGNTILDHLAEKYFAPNVIGYYDVKKGLLLCAASTNLDTTRKKLSTALLGDPGTAKSLLLQEATKLVANSTMVSAQSSSAISLTAIVETEKDSHVLRLGLIGWKTKRSSEKKMSIDVYDILVENKYPEKKIEDVTQMIINLAKLHL